MVMAQLLYISQEGRTKVMNLSLTMNFNKFYVRDLKLHIIRNELQMANSRTNCKEKFSQQISQPKRYSNLSWPNNKKENSILEMLLYNFRLILWNKELRDTDLVTNLAYKHIFHFKVRLVGGKGGFGATLRSQKPKHPMTMNFDACRDLSGRRIRHVRVQQELEEWHKERAEEEKKIEEDLNEFKKHEKEINAAIHSNDKSKEIMVK